jgi:hypothetical protein
VAPTESSSRRRIKHELASANNNLPAASSGNVAARTNLGGASKVGSGKALAEPFAAYARRKQQEESTLQQIGRILEGLDRTTASLVDRSASALQGQGANTRSNLETMKTFAQRPSTGITSLIGMINEVVHDDDR